MARAFLDALGVQYDFRDIKLLKPAREELQSWYQMSGLPLRRFFNTSGLQYKTLALKEKLPLMSEDEQLTLLSSDGMLVKRPILLGDGFVLVGFKQTEWEARFS
jgi:arsenate reductase